MALLTLALRPTGAIAQAEGRAQQEGQARGDGRAQEEERIVLDEAAVWDFAESLYRAGEYYRAISEYKRLIHFFPRSPQATEAQLRIGLAYLQGAEPERALEHIAALREGPEGPQDREGPEGPEDTALAGRGDDLRYLLGLSLLERDRGRPYPLRLEGIEAALAEFRAIASDWPERSRVAGFVEAMEQPPELPEKSPFLAGTFSAVIPGTGSAYVGRWSEAALAFFLTGVFIYATVTSFERDQVAAGTVFGALALAFYGGSIWAAVGGAHKFNDRHRTEYLAQQRTKFGIVVRGRGVGAAFERNF